MICGRLVRALIRRSLEPIGPIACSFVTRVVTARFYLSIKVNQPLANSARSRFQRDRAIDSGETFSRIFLVSTERFLIEIYLSCYLTILLSNAGVQFARSIVRETKRKGKKRQMLLSRKKSLLTVKRRKMERRVRRMKTVAKEMREIIARQLGGKMDKDGQLAQRSTDVLDTMLRTTVSLLRSGFLILSQKSKTGPKDVSLVS